MVRIITDSASDIDMKTAGELGIICVPLTVSFGKEQFKENVELSKTEFYKRLISDASFLKLHRYLHMHLNKYFERQRRQEMML